MSQLTLKSETGETLLVWKEMGPGFRVEVDGMQVWGPEARLATSVVESRIAWCIARIAKEISAETIAHLKDETPPDRIDWRPIDFENMVSQMWLEVGEQYAPQVLESIRKGTQTNSDDPDLLTRVIAHECEQEEVAAKNKRDMETALARLSPSDRALTEQDYAKHGRFQLEADMESPLHRVPPEKWEPESEQEEAQ
jgi:hypothetical protein